MKNFPVKVDGKEWWISRSVAVSVSIFTYINGELCVLANKRGPGLPNHVGEWNVVSGYIDFDETLKQTAIREVFEETNLDIKNVQLHQIAIEDDPNRENQVILFRYTGFYFHKNDDEPVVLSNKNSEPNEVSEIKFIPINELDKYKWTSKKHKENIINCAHYLSMFDSVARTVRIYIDQGKIDTTIKFK